MTKRKIAYGGSSSITFNFGGDDRDKSRIRSLFQKEQEKKKQKIKEDIRKFKNDFKFSEEREQEIPILSSMSPKLSEKHTKNISNKRSIDYLIDQQLKKFEEPKENVLITIIKNIGKKKPPKNMTIVQ